MQYALVGLSLILPGCFVSYGQLGSDDGVSSEDGRADASDLDATDSDALGDVVETFSCPPGMVFVAPGPFVMGSDLDEAINTYETPEHVVTLSPYCIDITEVTNAAYRTCEWTGSCTPPADSGGNPMGYGPDDQPVVYVSWVQAAAYCAWVRKRLPTEAEWEKAARGGCELVAPWTCGPEDERTYPWGETPPDCGLANSVDCVCRWGCPDRVGARPRGDSPYGIHDMAGNVWELVTDWWSETAYEACAAGCTDPTGPAASDRRPMRGGGHDSIAVSLRVAERGSMPDVCPEWSIGFRCMAGP